MFDSVLNVLGQYCVGEGGEADTPALYSPSEKTRVGAGQWEYVISRQGKALSPDPLAGLKTCLSLVKPGGNVVVSLPPAVGGLAASRLPSLLQAFSAEAELLFLQQDVAPASATVQPQPVLDVQPGMAFVLRKRRTPLLPTLLPDKQALIDRALRLYGAKEYESVLDLLQTHPWVAMQSADILNAAGASSFALKFPAAAIALYRQATELMPGHYDAWNNLGIALYDGGRLAEAELAHRRAIELKPDNVQFKGDLVTLLIRCLRLDEARAICEEVLATAPDSMFFIGELAAVLTRQGAVDEAHALFERLLALRPDDEKLALNVGVRLFQAGYHAEAEAVYRDAMARFSSEIARFHLSLHLLLTGRFADGWAHYEARAAVRKEPLPAYQFPLWQGEPIAGKRILIGYEQGFGDEIMMARYASMLHEAGAERVGMICRRQLVPLLKTLKGVDLLTPEAGDVVVLRDREFDFWTLPFEIPRYLGTDLESIPSATPYLWSLPERRARWGALMPKKGFKVGLVWKGSVIHPMDRERSLNSLAQLAPLWRVPGVSFISLQKGQGEDEAKAPPADQPLIDLGSGIKDFADTAALVDELDLVIAVDTSVVHVAGALNKPCWMMIPNYATDWRWLLEREDSPWYPSLRLFRQDATGDWAPTIGRLAVALEMEVGRLGK